MRILFILLFVIQFINAQFISIDDSRTPEQLRTILVNSSCFEFGAVNWSSNTSVGYFNRNGSSFPFEEGVILRSGNINFSSGPYTNTNLSTTTGLTITDPVLQALSNTSSGQTNALRDLSFFEFEFQTISNFINFNFIFASNEYGEYQCLSNDIFSIILTNLNTGISSNLAILPATGQPISVRTIRDEQYNPGCNSSNENLFANYNVFTPNVSPINFRGNTTLLNAASFINPNTPYRLRIAIADFSDNNYDSALFIQGGSIQSSINLGNDLMLCNNDTTILNTNLDSAGFTFEWFLDNVLIVGENNSSLTINQTGLYRVVATRGDCVLEDTIEVMPLTTITPRNIRACNQDGTGIGAFNLTQNNPTVLGLNPLQYEFLYYTSLENFNINQPIPASEVTSFVSSGQIIFIGIRNISTLNICENALSFQLQIDPPLNLATVEDNICKGANTTIINLNTYRTQILNGTVGQFTFRYYLTEQDAINNVNFFPSVVTIPPSVTSITYWVRVFYQNLTSCFALTSITINLVPLPLISEIEPIYIVCDEFEFPPIEHGGYYSLPNGQGINYPIGGTTIVDGIYYIFNSDGLCTNQTTFQVFIVDVYNPPLTACGVYSVPSLPEGAGAFYTEPGGPNGSGVLIPAGTTITNTGTDILFFNLYYYSEIEGKICVDKLFEITIFPTIAPIEVDDVYSCGSYVLTDLNNPNLNYYTQPNGQGTPLFAGDIISTDTTIYIYGSSNDCDFQTSFKVFILSTNSTEIINKCNSYTLPILAEGNYFSEPNGAGVLIPQGTVISTSRSVYIFITSGSGVFCQRELIINISIPPPVDSIPSDLQYCGNYTLEALVNGTYYLLPGGPDVPGQQELQPGMVIDLTGNNLISGQTYYIYNGTNLPDCFSQTEFFKVIIEQAPVDPIGDEEFCEPYTMSVLNGEIYTEPGGPNGTGTLVSPTEVFNETRTFYIYAINNTEGICPIDRQFTKFYYGINLPNFEDIYRCDFENYSLPPLNHMPPSPTAGYNIGYYFEPNGQNPVPTNFVFDTAGIYTIYVYAINQGRFVFCDEEKSFTIYIGTNPILPDYTIYEQQYCNTFTLPSLPVSPNHTYNYYTSSGGNASDLIAPNNYTFTEGGMHTVWLYGFSNINPDCYEELSFTFEILLSPNMSIPDQIICVDNVTSEPKESAILYSNVNPNIYTIEWYLNNALVFTGPTLMTSTPGVYEVVAYVTDPTSNTQLYCDYNSYTVTVGISSIATANVTVSPPFLNPNSVVVNLSGGFGEYLISLDNGPFGNQNIFENLSTGFHQVSIIDTLNDCGIIKLPFFIVDYPRFFTPNGDGYNEQWNVNRYQSALGDVKINIFDRFGKLIHIIASENQGWNGKYNGVDLPSSDYWFTFDYFDNNNSKQTFKAHFSLKR